MVETATKTTMRTTTQRRNVEATSGKANGEARESQSRRPETVPEGEERQQVRPHQLYCNPRKATRPRIDGVEARASKDPKSANLAKDAPLKSTLPWAVLHECEVVSAIMQARPFAACRLDDIPNYVLQLLLPVLLPFLVRLYRASLNLGRVPCSWFDLSFPCTPLTPLHAHHLLPCLPNLLPRSRQHPGAQATTTLHLRCSHRCIEGLQTGSILPG